MRLVTRSTCLTTLSTRLPLLLLVISLLVLVFLHVVLAWPLVVLVYPLVVLVCPLVVPLLPFVVLVCPFVVSVCPLVVFAVLSVGLFVTGQLKCQKWDKKEHSFSREHFVIIYDRQPAQPMKMNNCDCWNIRCFFARLINRRLTFDTHLQYHKSDNFFKYSWM